jgi:UDPglucose 6-dehydrogenase
MIGIIGYGMVGKAVKAGFTKTPTIYSDPKYNAVSIEFLCDQKPEVIFVCVPTPTDGSDYSILRSVLDKIKLSKFEGLTVVKSTALPHVLEDYDIVYNPEFLSRATAFDDFVNPPFILIGSNDGHKSHRLLEVYEKYSIVNLNNVRFCDIKTACLAKYTMNSFYATKLTFMNQIYDVAHELGVNWDDLKDILKQQPWMGTHHFDIPGPDGSRGFGGPCLPKDTEILAKTFNLELLNTVLELNRKYRQ